MSASTRMLAVIPARGGSKELPGKNIRPFAGLPLIAHSILFARMCPEIDRCIVSTDSPEIAEVARRFDAEVPFMRPAELARDEAPMWPVLRHALAEAGVHYEALLLLDPTSPAREPSDISQAVRRLNEVPDADGIIGVSRPDFHPIWHCVVERDGWMAELIEGGSRFPRRQEVPVTYRINGSLYIWRTGFVRREEHSWRRTDKLLMFEIPEFRAMSMDTEEQFARSELLVNSGMIRFPWMTQPCVR